MGEQFYNFMFPFRYDFVDTSKQVSSLPSSQFSVKKDNNGNFILPNTSTVQQNISTYLKNHQSDIVPFSEKFSNSTFGKNFGNWENGLNLVNTAFTGIFGEKSEYDGSEGHITKSLDSAYDTAQNLAGKLGPYGKIVSLGMSAIKLVGNTLNKLGGGTDGMTAQDAILGSSFLAPVGAINGFFGSKTDSITKDEDLFADVGSSFGGTGNLVDDALTKANKKYGLLSGGARHKANSQIREAKRQQDLMGIIGDYNSDRRLISQSTSAINHNNYMLNMQGGYDQSAIRVGKKGLKISPKKAREITRKKKIQEEVAGFQKGGKTLDLFQVYLNTLPENQRDTTNYRVKDYWKFNGKPKDFEEALSKGMFIKDKKGFYHANSISENPETGEIEYMKASDHPTRYMESDWYEKGLVYNDDGTTTQLKPGVDGYDNWKDFVSNYELIKSEPYWKYVRRTSKTPEFKDGGSIIELTSFIELISPDDIPEFKDGGSINVIPGGALHARKHNMDMEGITKKGIPVVSNDGEQQAEVEREEIIYRLSVTQELERLCKIYYNEKTSKKEKDEVALQAGKLIVLETLHNTIDNTGNLL